MSERVFTVVCSGRGGHRRRLFNKVTVTAEGLCCNVTRTANMPEFKGVYVDGVEVLGKAVMPATYNPREGGRWRWKCADCGADARFSDGSLRKWLGGLPNRSADISTR